MKRRVVRSFDYAARVAFPDDDDGTWSQFWRHWVSVAFLQAYLSAVDPALLPRDRDDLHLLLDTLLMERTLSATVPSGWQPRTRSASSTTSTLTGFGGDAQAR